MGEYIVSARKYRPGSFDDVVGQQHVTSTLKSALHKEQLAQAYLFTGPRGVGKTTCARILAKVVNCENPIDKNTACNECGSCKAFDGNASFNIFELDAASNNSVDHIRMLIDEQVRYLPQKGKYKVFIIDEVHMLTKAAFNAFLKTLEEPPEHAIFILATTEKHKIIPTILSRCQIYDFRMIQVSDIVKQLELICENENIKAEKDALHIIGQKADGAMRDALSIFDRIVSSSESEIITYKQVLKNLNLLDYEYFFKITDYLIQSDLSNILLLFSNVLREGFEANLFVTGLSEHLRQLLISKDPRTHILLEVGEDLKNRYINQSNLIDKGFVLTALSILNKCDYHFPLAQNKRLHVEITLSKICHINDAKELLHSSPEKKKINSINKSESPIDVKSREEKKSSIAPESITEKTEKKKILENNNTQDLKEIQSKGSISNDIGESKLKESKIISNSKFKVPRLNDLLDEIKKEEENLKEPIPTDVQIVKNVVFELLNIHSSQIVTNVLKELDFEADNGNLIVYVPTNLSKDILSQEKDFLINIRKAHHNPLLDIEIIVDMKKFPDHQEIKTKKILSTKEKYELLLVKNPLIKDFIKDFDLHIDS